MVEMQDPYTPNGSHHSQNHSNSRWSYCIMHISICKFTRYSKVGPGSSFHDPVVLILHRKAQSSAQTEGPHQPKCKQEVRTTFLSQRDAGEMAGIRMKRKLPLQINSTQQGTCTHLHYVLKIWRTIFQVPFNDVFLVSFSIKSMSTKLFTCFLYLTFE